MFLKKFLGYNGLFYSFLKQIIYRLFIYDIELVTSIDNFRKIMKEAEEEFNKNGMEIPTIYCLKNSKHDGREY